MLRLLSLGLLARPGHSDGLLIVIGLRLAGQVLRAIPSGKAGKHA